MNSSILISSPYGPESRSGNWRTACRYADLLQRAGVSVRLAVGLGRPRDWQDLQAVLVLHARRSHTVAQHARARGIALGVVITGTDLYGDLGPEGAPEHAAQCAETLGNAVLAITLQQEAHRHLLGLREQRPEWRDLRLICLPQSSSWAGRPRVCPASPHDCLMVGHVRPEKDPETGFRGFLKAHLQDPALGLVHLGASLDDPLMGRLRLLADARPQAIQMRGSVGHDEVRAWMDQRGVLIHPSRSEGGALVLAEAIARGLWILASDIPGNRGVLGPDFPGFFPAGDANALAHQLLRLCRDETFQRELQAAAAVLLPLLGDPGREQAALLQALQPLLRP